MRDSYWLRLGRRSEGPFALDEVRRRAMRGRVTPGHSVSRDGKSWVAARGCREIFSEDGTPVPPGQGGAMPMEPSYADADADFGEGAFAHHESAAAPLAVSAAANSFVAAWPAHAACAATLGLACGLPMSRDAEGPLWWWHLVRLGDLGGAGLVTAAVSWALVSACAVGTSAAIWLRSGPARLLLLSGSAIASMALAAIAWAAGMAGGVWTLAQCALVPAAAWSVALSAERSRVPSPAHPGARHPIGAGLVAAGALGALSIVLGAVSILVRDGAAGMACALLMLVSGGGMLAGVVRWRLAGADEWTTMIPCGVVAMACGAIVCDGLAAMAATPVPPACGTRFAVLDALRVIAVLLCQCTLAYLAHRDHHAAPYAPPAIAHQPGTKIT